MHIPFHCIYDRAEECDWEICSRFLSVTTILHSGYRGNAFDCVNGVWVTCVVQEIYHLNLLIIYEYLLWYGSRCEELLCIPFEPTHGQELVTLCVVDLNGELVAIHNSIANSAAPQAKPNDGFDGTNIYISKAAAIIV